MVKDTSHPPLSNSLGTREEVLMKMSTHFDSDFQDRGLPLPVPAKRNFGCGFGHRNLNGKRLFEVHATANSAEGIAEAFISPLLAKTETVLPILHQALCLMAANHNGKKLHQVAAKLGWDGPRKNMQAQDWLVKRFAQVAEAVGPYPHAALVLGDLNATSEAVMEIVEAKPKQKGRQLRLVCLGGTPEAKCDFSARAPQEFISKVACADHRDATLVVWNDPKNTPDPRDVPYADPLPKAAE